MKQKLLKETHMDKDVAPHAGAWIETMALAVDMGRGNGRAPRGRVD